MASNQAARACRYLTTEEVIEGIFADKDSEDEFSDSEDDSSLEEDNPNATDESESVTESEEDEEIEQEQQTFSHDEPQTEQEENSDDSTKPEISQYLGTDPLLVTPIFNNIMSRNCYQSILESLHFNDNTFMMLLTLTGTIFSRSDH